MNLFILSTVSCLLEYVVPPLIKYITSRLYTISKNDMELHNDLIGLKQEMAGISIVDDFPKYAKLQRKYNKVEGVLKEKVNERLSSRMKAQICLTYGFRIINGLLMVILLLLYKNKPVIILPKDALWPMQNFLSWPCYEENSISLMMWVIITRLLSSVCKNVNAI